MDGRLKAKAIVKLAFYGPAPVAGAPAYFVPPPTVGQLMYNAGAFGVLSNEERRKLYDGVVDTGVNVNSPAKKLLGAGIGALAGNFIANALGAGPFARGMATAIGANYGYK